ncbi:MAG: site-specific DNA-methyltransferase, partial [Deltaproteobacteria bacterium]|nr:site-specific DNA-methyltransferase [Deltaproteobacteria bacterium]
SPIMREWLSSNPVNREDMLRHDKWCAMMWPRLKLLHELLAETGSLWMTLDDNEVHRARMVLDEIFGDANCIGQIAWQKRTSRENRAALSPSIDHLMVYTKANSDDWKSIRNLLPQSKDGYANPDNDQRGVWKSIPFSAQGYRKNQQYDIITPSGRLVRPPKGRSWGATEPEFLRLRDIEKKIYWPSDGDGLPRIKQYPAEAKGLVPDTLWLAAEVGDTENSKKLLLELFAVEDDFGLHAPKPVELIQRIIEIAASSNSLTLDSFAGSGTTAHAVLEANRKDGGNRRFILVECEDYADTLTAERVRRVMNGYPFTGKHKETLLREKLTWTKLQRASNLLHQISGLEALHAPNFDRIKKEIKDGELIVTGEKDIAATKPGLGGSFTYCTLGEPVDIDALLTGANLPDYAALGAWVFYTATNQTLRPDAIDPERFYLGESSHYHVWLIYKPDLDFLKSNDSALTLSRAETIAATHRDKRHLVFAPVKFVPNKTLLPLGVEFAQLPYAIYRREQA